MTQRPTCDVCVVGGGPAGAGVAAELARAGARVILLERTDYSRHRPGEHFAPDVVEAAERLGVQCAPTESIGTVALWHRAGPMFRPALFSPFGGGRTVVRRFFDRSLANAAAACGADVRREHQVYAVRSRGNERIELHVRTPVDSYRLHAPLVLDATGRHAAVARRLGARTHYVDDSIALVACTRPLAESPAWFASLHLEAVEDGWWYAIALPDRSLSITLFTTMSCVRRSGLQFRAFWQRALTASQLVAPEMPRLVSDLPLRAYPCAPALLDPMYGEGWIALGDAAMQLDPLEGRGVRNALQSAFAVAQFAATGSRERQHRLQEYSLELRSTYDRHREGRRAVYGAAAARLGDSFVADIDPAAVIGSMAIADSDEADVSAA